MKLAIFFAILVVMFGCTQSGPAPDANATAPAPPAAEPAQPPAEPPQPPPAMDSGDWTTYAITGLSFKHPEGLKIQESLSSYREGEGYGVIMLQDANISDPIILIIGYYNLSGGNLDEANAALYLLQSDNKGEDQMGVLHQASEKGAITEYAAGQGYQVAEMAVKVVDEGSGKALEGYAVQTYDPVSRVGIKARILSMSLEKARTIKERFVESLRIG